MSNNDILLLNQIGLNANTNAKMQRENTVHIYSYSPGFTLSQQFFLALGFQPIGNILLGFQDITCEAEDMNLYSIKDVKDNQINLNDTYDGNSQTVSRFNCFINSISKCDKDINEIIDGLFDRNPDLVDSLQAIMEKYCAYGREINFVNLDESNKSFIADKIRSDQDYYLHYLFYSKMGIPKQSDIFNSLPFNVFIQKDYFGDKLANLKKIFNEKKKKKYYQMTFIIGSKNGIPILMLFNDNCAICSVDNKTKIVNNYEDISKSIDYVYMIYYSLDENLSISQRLFQDDRSGNNDLFNLHTRINDETDEILKRYISYKIETSWNVENKDFNLIELIQESIQYPFFFGICSGFSIGACYYGTIMLLYDTKSADRIFSSNSDDPKYANAKNFYIHYQTFTNFVMHLFEFLRELGFIKESQNKDHEIDYQKIDNQCNYMFATIPPINDMLFDLFVNFIHEIIKADILPKEVKNNFIKYLYHTVANFRELGFEKKNISTETFTSLFKKDNVSSSTTNEILMGYKCLKIEENLISKRIGLKDYKQEYPKLTEYTSFLESTYLPAIIHL